MLWFLLLFCRGGASITGRSLDLGGPIYVGGLRANANYLAVVNRHFDGCIRDVKINKQLLDLSTPLSQGVGVGLGVCPALATFCDSTFCLNGGTCQNVWNASYCICPRSFGGKRCEHGEICSMLYRLFAGHLCTLAVPWVGSEKVCLLSVQLAVIYGLSNRFVWSRFVCELTSTAVTRISAAFLCSLQVLPRSSWLVNLIFATTWPSNSSVVGVAWRFARGKPMVPCGIRITVCFG